MVHMCNACYCIVVISCTSSPRSCGCFVKNTQLFLLVLVMETVCSFTSVLHVVKMNSVNDNYTTCFCTISEVRLYCNKSVICIVCVSELALVNKKVCLHLCLRVYKCVFTRPYSTRVHIDESRWCEISDLYVRICFLSMIIMCVR